MTENIRRRVNSRRTIIASYTGPIDPFHSFFCFFSSALSAPKPVWNYTYNRENTSREWTKKKYPKWTKRVRPLVWQRPRFVWRFAWWRDGVSVRPAWPTFNIADTNIFALDTSQSAGSFIMSEDVVIVLFLTPALTYFTHNSHVYERCVVLQLGENAVATNVFTKSHTHDIR